MVPPSIHGLSHPMMLQAQAFFHGHSTDKTDCLFIFTAYVLAVIVAVVR